MASGTASVAHQIAIHAASPSVSHAGPAKPAGDGTKTVSRNTAGPDSTTPGRKRYQEPGGAGVLPSATGAGEAASGESSSAWMPISTGMPVPLSRFWSA